ncbi:MAG: 2-keto-3-deoxy-L-fuconate dehydrogenase [Akkermansiaceae bacterium]|jgi:2-keto-3-deoxy-L-fuconate dehydrogenase
MSQKLQGKVAVVTGGGSGIGRAISERFAAEGALVCVLDFDENLGAETLAMIGESGGQASFYQCDVGDQARVADVFELIKNDHAPLDVLVNNAGVPAIGNVDLCTTDDFERIFRVNVKGIFHCLKEAVAQMKGRGGAIINMASVASHIGIPDRFAYSMSKGAVLTMSRSIATDYVGEGIRSNTISPGRVHTPFVDGFLAQNYPGKEAEMFEKLSATQPIGRMAKPEEIAGLALYLASEEASFITGSDFPIDGGFIKVKN